MKYMFKRFTKKLIYQHRSSSEEFIKYLVAHGCRIGKGTYFFDPVDCAIDPVRLDYIEIGEYCKITSGFVLLAHDYSWSVLRRTHGCLLPSGGEHTRIGNNVFIGMRVTVLKGVNIGDNVIIGANSLVTKDIPSNTVYAGNPARFIMNLEDYYKKRVENFMNDVKRNFRHLVDKYDRYPTINELGFYSILFLDRTQDNWDKYVSKISLPGDNENEVRDIFMNSKPVYKDYEAFIKSLSSDNSV